MFEWTVVLAAPCPPARAFDHIGRGFFEHHPLWDPSVTSMRKTTPGPVAAGTRGLEGRQFGPWKIVSEFEVTAFEPDRRFGFRTTSGPMHEAGDWTIEPRDGGSEVSIRLRLIPVSGGMRLLAPLMRPVFERNVGRNVERMQAALDELVDAAEASAAMGASPAS